MENEDELVEGAKNTEYRKLDSRIGRWMSVDPAANLYYSWSPYNLSMDNPILNSDPSGATVVDPGCDNEAVIINIDKENGTATYSLGDGSSVSSEFLENGGHIIDKMVKTETGREMVNRAITIPTEVTYVLDREKPYNETTRFGYTIGTGRVKGEDGKVYYKKATVTLNHQKIGVPDAFNRFLEDGGTYEEAMNAVGVHEGGHLDPDNIIKDREDPNSIDYAEVFPINLEYQTRKEYRESVGNNGHLWNDKYINLSKQTGNTYYGFEADSNLSKYKTEKPLNFEKYPVRDR